MGITDFWIANVDHIGEHYFQSDIRELLNELFDFEIPDLFMPDQDYLWYIGDYVFGNLEAWNREAKKAWTTDEEGNNYNRSAFFEMDEPWHLPPFEMGYYSIGRPDYDRIDYRFGYRENNGLRDIWLEFEVDEEEEFGVDESGDGERLIEMYLSELELFLMKALRAGIYVKVWDLNSMGDFRLELLGPTELQHPGISRDVANAKRGYKVRFDKSLFPATRDYINGEFNRMLAVFDALFIDDDENYMAWLAKNPDGWVLNAARQPKAGYLVVHRSGCGTISRPGVRYTGGDYLKKCDRDLEVILAWAMRETGNTPDMCQLCFALADKSLVTAVVSGSSDVIEASPDETSLIDDQNAQVLELIDFTENSENINWLRKPNRGSKEREQERLRREDAKENGAS